MNRLLVANGTEIGQFRTLGFELELACNGG